MKKFAIFYMTLFFMACSSESPMPEADPEQQTDDEIIVDDEGKEEMEEEMEDDDATVEVPFEKVVLIAIDLDNTTLENIFYEVELNSNGETTIKNLSQEFGFQDLLSFELQPNGTMVFLDDLGIGSDGQPVRKVFVRNLKTGITSVIEDYFNIIEARDLSKIFTVKSNSENLFGLIFEDEIIDGSLFANYEIYKSNLDTNISEQIWSSEAPSFNQRKIDFGSQIHKRGVIVSQDYLSLDYAILEPDAQNQYLIDVFDVNSMQPLKLIDSDSPMTLIQQTESYLLLSKPGKLELHDLVSNTFKTSDNTNVSNLRIDHAFIDKSKLIFGRITGNSSFNTLKFLDFDSNSFTSIGINDLRRSLVHIPSNSPLEGVEYTVDFENEIYLIVYSYFISGSRKYELGVFKFSGELISYFKLPKHNFFSIFVN